MPQLLPLRLLWLWAGLFLFGAGLPARAQAPPYAWAAGVGTTALGQVGSADRHDCDVTALAVTRTGETYVTGSFKQSVEFGATTLVSAGAQDVFLAKLDATGRALWAVRAGDRGDDLGFGLAVDAADHVYVTGTFRYSATFGPVALTTGGDIFGFVAKFDPQGGCQWARSIPQAGNVGAVAVDARGDLVLNGTFLGNAIQFGATTLQGQPAADNAFVAKLSALGAWVWAVRSGNRTGSLALDEAGNVYCTGSYVDTNTFGPFTLTASGLQDGFVGKLDPAGQWRWVRSAGGSSYDYAGGVGVDYAGNVWVVGGFYPPSATFGSITIANRGAGNFDAYVAKLDAQGNYLWAVGAGGTDNDLANDVAVDDDGSAYVIGQFQDYGPGGTFGDIVLPNLGRRYGQCYVAKLTPAGAFDWVATTSSGTSYSEFGQGVALDHRGGVYAAGTHTGPGIGFGATTLPGNPGAHTGFLAKLSDRPLAVVADLAPAQGAAGTTVTVRGARLAGATAVYFNGQRAASFAVTSPTTLTAVAPVGVTTGPVSVQTPAGLGPAGFVFQTGTLTATAGASTPASGCWPNPLPSGERLQLGAAQGRGEADLYTLVGQRVLSRPVSAAGEVTLGPVPRGSYVLVVRTPGHTAVRYPLRVQ